MSLGAGLALLAVLAASPPASPRQAEPGDSASGASVSTSDTLRFEPLDEKTAAEAEMAPHRFGAAPEGVWLRTPYGERLLTDLEIWRARGRPGRRIRLIADYNRVDQLRLGVNVEVGGVEGRVPRAAGRIEISDGRDLTLYGFELEQLLVPSGRYAVGGSLVHRTDHLDLQQIEDLENTLAVLLARRDHRDYFGREGGGIYLRWRVPDFSAVSLHLRRDTWESLPVQHGTRSWLHLDRALRDNPPIDAGDSRSVSLRLERLAHRTASLRAGLYHAINVEWAGGDLGGDFDYTRALVDLRGVMRVSPAATLALRAVGGSEISGRLAAQREFTLGGVDGLRGHEVDAFRGDQVALGQAEYTIGLWRFASDYFESGIHAFAFLDAGTAWRGTPGRWDVGHQHFATDAGFGFGTSEDNLRVYLARRLQDPGSDFVVSFRLQRPF